MSEGVIVFGGGGHAKVVISTLLSLNIEVGGIIDDDQRKWGQRILDIPILGSQESGDLENRRGVIAIGDNSTRRRLVEQMTGVEWETIVHPSAYVHPSVSIGAGTVVFAGVIVQPDVVIGDHCILNSNATVDHDCVIGDFVHIGPGASLAGGVSVREGTLMGIGSVAVAGVNIGQWTVIGAAGVVIGDIPDNITAVGIPARPIGSPEK